MNTETLGKLIDMADAHQKADEYKSGHYEWNGGACAIGCTIRDAQKLKVIPESIRDDDHHAGLERLGVPELAWWLCDSIFEGLPANERPAWTPRFLRAIRAGADYSRLPARIMARLSGKLADDVIDPNLKPVCMLICDLWTRRAYGNEPPESEWKSARQQAYAARQQAYAAWQQADVVWQQANAAWQQAYAAWYQAYAARQQADAARQQADAVWQQANAAWQQANAARQQANAAWQQAYAAWYQAYAAQQQADAVWQQANAAWQQFWQWCGDMLCEELARAAE